MCSILATFKSKNCPVVWAVDEAGQAHQMLMGEFKSQRGEKRGLLTPLAAMISYYRLPAIFAATNRSLGQGRTLASDIGKTDFTRILTKFDLNETIEHVSKELNVIILLISKLIITEILGSFRMRFEKNQES